MIASLPGKTSSASTVAHVRVLVCAALVCGCTSESVVTSDGTPPNIETETVEISFTRIAAGELHSCALTLGGELFCSGSNSRGQLGFGTLDDNPHGVPAQLPTDLIFVDISAGARHSCAIATGAELYCWGDNSRGQLGDGTTVSRFSPVRVVGRYVSVSAYEDSTCAIGTNGTAYCWGSGVRGKLGNRTEKSVVTPRRVSDSVAFATVEIGAFHGCGVAQAGATYCWGWIDRVGSTDVDAYRDNGMAEPILVEGQQEFTAVTASTHHSCGVTKQRDVYCWGANADGIIGNGEVGNDVLVPALVVGGLSLRSVSAGANHSCAVTTDRLAYCWGRNERGELGDGRESQDVATAPRAVSGGLSFTWISAGGVHSCGVTVDRKAYCWGGNERGQLGVGSTIDTNIPIPIITGALP